MPAGRELRLRPKPASLRLTRFEIVSLSLCLASWLCVLLDASALVELEGLVPMGLYPLYSFAIFVGSVAGNAFVFRTRRALAVDRGRLLRLYLAAPAGLVLLARAMTRGEDQAATPLVPLYAVLVFAIFFGVPLLIRRPPR